MTIKREKVLDTFPVLKKISNKELREKVISVWLKALKNTAWQSIEEIPFYPGVDKSRGNLARHTRAVAYYSLEVAAAMSDHYPYVINKDFLLAGALLHDVSKAVEYEDHKKTALGDCMAHGVYGVHLCLEEELPLEVTHIVSSHTKQMNIEPNSLEALIVHYCDHLDANGIALENGLAFF